MVDIENYKLQMPAREDLFVTMMSHPDHGYWNHVDGDSLMTILKGDPSVASDEDPDCLINIISDVLGSKLVTPWEFVHDLEESVQMARITLGIEGNRLAADLLPNALLDIFKFMMRDKPLYRDEVVTIWAKRYELDKPRRAFCMS